LVRVQGRSSDARVSLGDGEPVAASGERTAGGLAVHWGGEYLRYAGAEAPDGALGLSRDGVAGAVGERPDPAPGQGGDGEGEPVAASGERTAGGLAVHWGGEYLRYARAEAPDGALWLSRDGVAVAVGERPNLLAGQADDVEGGPVTSPMPGTVLVVKVAEGDE